MALKADQKNRPVSKSTIKEEKEDWNDTVQLLIAKLIAFKKGLNGIGDTKAHLPPVGISDPFPTEMSVYLNSIVDDYVAIIDGAKDIMQDQKEYSKKQKNIHGLSVQASWWGSRTWARLGLLGLGKQRKLRLNMISFANETIHDLYNIENNLTGWDKSGVAKAVKRTLKLMNEYVHNFIPLYNQLMEEIEEPKELKKSKKQKEQEIIEYYENIEPEEDLPDQKVVTSPSKEQHKEPPKKIVPRSKEIIYTEPVLSGKEVFDKIRQIESEYGKFQYFAALIRVSTAPTSLEKVEAERAWADLVSAHIDMLHDKISPAEPFTQDQKKNINNYINAEKNLVEIFSKVRDKYYGSWEKMEEDSSAVEKESAIDYFVKEEKEIMKIAHNVLTRWINKKLTGLSSKKINIMKMEVVENIQKMTEALNEFMDILESRQSTSIDISTKFNYISRLLSEIGKALWPVGKNYLLNQDEMSKTKGKINLRLNDKILRDLETQSQTVLGKKIVSDIKTAIMQLKSDIEPEFNNLNIEMYPGGVLFDIKPLLSRDGEAFIGVVVSPNGYIKQLGNLDILGNEELDVLYKWKEIKEYILGSFKNKIKEKYEEQLGHPIVVRVLE